MRIFAIAAVAVWLGTAAAAASVVDDYFRIYEFLEIYHEEDALPTIYNGEEVIALPALEPVPTEERVIDVPSAMIEDELRDAAVEVLRGELLALQVEEAIWGRQR